MVACCVTTARGLWRPAIRTSAAGCTPPRNGEACTAHFPNLEDACSPDTGCSTSLCGNGVVDPDEECDGQSACGPDCRLARVACCDFTFPGGGAACFGRTEYQDGDVYTSVGKPCVTTLFGTSSSGICGDGPPCPDPAPPELGCRLASCTDQPIDPLPLCCEQAAGGCRDTVATTAGAIGDFGCSTFPPPEEGEVDRLLVGTCGDDGRCVPAS